MNKVMLSGNLGKDPRPFQFSNGGTKASFQLAVDRTYRDGKGNLQKRTEWPSVVLYGKQAQQAQAALDYLKQGRRVEIEGRLQTRSYDKNGQRHFVTEVVAERMKFVPGGNGKPNGTPQDNPQPHDEVVLDEQF
jgi:single-strand DNA-binding protein